MYIFLDVDGVLNKESDWRTKMYTLNPDCVNAFQVLLNSIKNPKIVLSSTWRNGIARDGKTAVYIDDLLDALKESGITYMDKTAIAPDGSRSREIDYYLRRHDPDCYIILDDDESIFENGSKTKGLYLTEARTGLTLQDVKRIKKIFL